MQHIYKQWGPSAQTCIQLTQDPTAEATHEAAVQLAASCFVKDTDAIGDYYDERIQHILLSMSPHKENRQIPTVDIATDRILRIISYAVADAKAQEQIKFYHDISKQQMFRASAGKIFKRFVLTWLSSDLAPLACIPVDSSRLQIPTCGEEKTICGRLAALKSMQVDKFPFCFLPTKGSDTLSAIDAIVFTQQSIITIQIITSDPNQYSANEGDFAEIENHLPTITTTRRTWKMTRKPHSRCHVLITDDEAKARTLTRRGQTLSGNPKLPRVYSAVFAFGQFEITSEQMRRLDEARVRVLVACEQSAFMERITATRRRKYGRQLVRNDSNAWRLKGTRSTGPVAVFEK